LSLRGRHTIATAEETDEFASQISVGWLIAAVGFDDAPPLRISIGTRIGTRPEVGEGFGPAASLFK
jgi:hypothetical protein